MDGQRINMDFDFSLHFNCFYLNYLALTLGISTEMSTRGQKFKTHEIIQRYVSNGR